jgi:hypothetical protein
MNSFNHYSLDSVAEWMYRKMAGIDLDSAQPGYKHIVFDPIPGGHLTFVSGTYESIHGTIHSEWKRDGSKYTLKVKVPVNTTATVGYQGLFRVVTKRTKRLYGTAVKATGSTILRLAQEPMNLVAWYSKTT